MARPHLDLRIGLSFPGRRVAETLANVVVVVEAQAGAPSLRSVFRERPRQEGRSQLFVLRRRQEDKSERT